jgi:hypothetical protein
MYQYNLNPQVGPDNMLFLAGIKNDDDRIAAEQALIQGKSPDAVKVAVRSSRQASPSEGSAGEEQRARLEKEKRRLERTIASLTKRLDEVEEELGSL